MKILNIITGLLLIFTTVPLYAGGGRAGTEDINIGVGELQDSSSGNQAITGQDYRYRPGPGQSDAGPAETGGSADLNNDDDGTKAGLLVPAVQRARSSYGKDEKSEKSGNVETEWKVEEGVK